MKKTLIAFVFLGLSVFAANAAIVQSSAPAIAQSPANAGIQKFEEADTNHDGVLTLDEWKAAGHRERGFNLIDADKDGKITPAELIAAAKKYGR